MLPRFQQDVFQILRNFADHAKAAEDEAEQQHARGEEANDGRVVLDVREEGDEGEAGEAAHREEREEAVPAPEWPLGDGDVRDVELPIRPGQGLGLGPRTSK